ncbi:MAG: ribonuclease H-like domain-containing protein [Candidatus Micrarchaeota archaeon]|nr:ribonuclease H-like domain-containing protein [Candidatus Micrarchaeota archaeon]
MAVRIECFVIDVDYTTKDNQVYIRVTAKSGEGKSYELVDKGFRPYFYLLPKEGVTAGEVMDFSFPERDTMIRAVQVDEEKRRLFGKTVTFFRITVATPTDVPKLSGALARYGQAYESDIPFAKRYVIDTGIVPLTKYSFEIERDGEINAIKSYAKSEDSSMPALNVLCFDIETYNPLNIPRPDKDAVIMISYAYVSNGKSGHQVITYRDTDEGSTLVVKDEKQMFKEFIKKLNELDIDIVSGYNSANFDVKYMLERAKAIGIECNFGRYSGTTRIERHGLVDMVKMPGRVHVDMYPVVRFVQVVGAQENILKLADYKLKTVYEALSGGKKVTVENKQEIWKMWDGPQETFDELVRYNLSDSDALEFVYDTLMPLMAELSRITGDMLSDVVVSTAGQLVEFTLMRFARSFGEVIPNKPDDTEIRNRQYNPIEGAYVKTPEAGVYDNIVVFDFRGLYPSIIISHNIDPSSLCTDCTDYFESPTGDRFDKKIKAITPTILGLFIEQRTSIKKQYKKDPDNVMLGARSQALKIVANSFYGYLGYARSRWYSRQCAGSVTAYGRQYIADTIEQAGKAGFKVLYGDSIGRDSIVRVRVGRRGMEYKRIEGLFSSIDELGPQGKEYHFPKDLYVETLDGNCSVALRKVNYVMRHKTKKPMYRVWLTNTLYIDATEDHSLIGFVGLAKMKGPVHERLVQVKPTELRRISNSLVVKKKSYPCGEVTRGYNRLLYELMGFFIGDGSFHRVKYRGKPYRIYYLGIAAGKEGDEILGNLLEPLKRAGAIRNIVDKGRGDFLINGLEMVRLFEKEILQDGKKRIPDFVFREKKENVISFLRGLFSSEGTVIIRGGKPIIRYTTIDRGLADQIHRLLWEVGISSSVFRENNENMYGGKGSGTFSYHIHVKNNDRFVKDIGFITKAKTKRISGYKETSFQKRHIRNLDFDISQVRKVERISYDGYVYDLGVRGCHRFFANGVLVHNTDSIFLMLAGKSRDSAYDFLKTVNAVLPAGMELELEDFYRRGVFVGKKSAKDATGAKKKYALINEAGRIKIRGFELVRRDWSRIARDTQRMVLKTILEEGSPEKAAAIVKDVVQRLRGGKVPLSDLVISTQLRKGMDRYDSKSPELGAARKAVEAGFKTKYEVEHSVINYIITRSGSSISEKAQLEGMAKDYDPEYYIDHQVLPATMKLLKELDFSEEQLKDSGKQKKLM